MFQVIEGTTTEVTLGPPTDDNHRVIRIQRGGQKVNDQIFKAYAFLESTSHQYQHEESGTNMTRQVMMSRKLSEKTPKKFELLTILGSFGTIIGFVVQFVGLRVILSTNLLTCVALMVEGHALVSHNYPVR